MSMWWKIIFTYIYMKRWAIIANQYIFHNKLTPKTLLKVSQSFSIEFITQLEHFRRQSLLNFLGSMLISVPTKSHNMYWKSVKWCSSLRCVTPLWPHTRSIALNFELRPLSSHFGNYMREGSLALLNIRRWVYGWPFVRRLLAICKPTVDVNREQNRSSLHRPVTVIFTLLLAQKNK